MPLPITSDTTNALMALFDAQVCAAIRQSIINDEYETHLIPV